MTDDDEQWWDVQCGEYVLGTLRGAERDVLDKILRVDPDVQRRVTYWEASLGPLESRMQLMQPPEHVLPQILAQIRGDTTSHDEPDHTLGDEQAEPPPASAATSPTDLTGTWTEDIDNVLAADQTNSTDRPDISLEPYQQQHTEPLRKGNRFWKYVAVLSTTAALFLAGMLFKQTTQNPKVWPIPAEGSLSVLQDDDQHALWLLTIASSSNQATVVALAPPPLRPDQSHQLWMIKSDDAGVDSVGLMPRAAGQSRVIDLAVPIAQATHFAVSLEPATGSPESGPTGPVLFRGIIQQSGESNR